MVSVTLTPSGWQRVAARIVNGNYWLALLFNRLFRTQGTHVDVVYICEMSSMPSLLVCVSVAAVVVAVLATVPGKSHHEIEFLYQLLTNTCSDGVATLCDCSFCVIQISALSWTPFHSPRSGTSCQSWQYASPPCEPWCSWSPPRRQGKGRPCKPSSCKLSPATRSQTVFHSQDKKEGLTRALWQCVVQGSQRRDYYVF